MAVTVLAVAEETGWWDTDTGQRVGDMLRWLVAVGIVAAAWKGVRYLMAEVLGIHRWGISRRQETNRRESLLDDMLSPEGWPALVGDVQDIKVQLEEVHGLVNDRMQTALDRIEHLEQLLEKNGLTDTVKE